MKRTRNACSIFRTILLPLLLVVVMEVLLLLGSLILSGVQKQLNENSQAILDKQVENRLSYLEGSMVGNWADLSLLASDINAHTQALLDAGTLSLEDLDSSSDACTPLLLTVYENLVETLYAKKVSGIFLVFNTRDLDQAQAEADAARTGIYIRDLDPASAPSYRSADLLLERAPIAVVRAMGISTDSGWQPLFTYETAEGVQYDDFLYYPFQAALKNTGTGEAADFGYWNPKSYILPGDDRAAISYSIPLILEDGTVYGVLGVDLITDYLETMLPYEELFEDAQGTYLLAYTEDGLTYTPILVRGAAAASLPPSFSWTPGSSLALDGAVYHTTASGLSIYNSNAPFSSQRWVLMGMVREDHLYAFSHRVSNILILAALISLLAGIAACFLVSRRLSRPIQSLSAQVAKAQREKDGIPRLTPTGILEIDRFSQAITALSRDVVDSSTRFLRIMEMASLEMGGFEIRQGETSVFVTENFFHLLGRDDVHSQSLDAEGFGTLMDEIRQELHHTENSDGSTLYRIPLPQGGVRYLRVETAQVGERLVGIAEDVTLTTLERLRIEHERDYDLLTGLYNRRAFLRVANLLLEQASPSEHAALLMLDLDNLKNTNDRFGHDWGDQYIRRAAQSFVSGTPEGTLCARVSGDEFFLLFHGYKSRDEIRQVLSSLVDHIRASSLILPNGDKMYISASGGVAWYPEDSQDLSELMKYTDFAMYQVKQKRKGEFGEFDFGIYSREAFQTASRLELCRLLDEELLYYHFQPIVDAHSGKIVAYEALMRTDLPTLHTPEAILRLARAEGKLPAIERLSWFTAAACFQDLLAKGQVAPDAYLFINSISSLSMSPEDEAEFQRRFSDLQPRIILEVTESEDLDMAALESKRIAPGFSGLFALDDYGSGYNSEKNLLALAPRFVKVDISIVRDVDSDADKQQIITNIVHYAHTRNMYIVAEGLETAAEVTTVLDLGVDLLQGFYLARPTAVPPAQIDPGALHLLEDFWQDHTQE